MRKGGQRHREDRKDLDWRMSVVDKTLSLCGRVSHVCLCVLDGDTKLLGELFELLEVLAGAGTGGLVSLLEELCAVLGDSIHDFLEVLQLVHLGWRWE